jgi:hypothetical protein
VRRFRTTIIVAAGIGALTNAGCYGYRILEAGRVRPGQTVHVTLTPSGAAELASTIGPNATSIDGRVLSASDSGVTIAVTQIARTVGPEEFMRDEPVGIPLRSASTMLVREFDRSRTVLAVGGVLAGAFTAARVAEQAGLGSSTSGRTSSSH